MEHLDELNALPDRERREKIDKRKRMIEALDHYEKETLQSSIDVSNDDKKCDVLKKHMDMMNNDMKAACADLTTVFLSYLDNFGSPHFPETTTLDAIEDSLLELTPFLSARPVGKDCIDRFPIAVAAWLTYRRTIFSVHTAHTTALLPSQILSPFTIKIKNSCLITKLRKAHRDYLATETGGLWVYEILAGGFVALQNTFEERRRIEVRVREGLEGLERSLVGLGDELGKGAGRWIVGWE
ncbi:hypothetical protein ACET3X_000145 [Alternaria dauci]|uniref:Uncharacterized protein n=1 Tax=Alternaria dauci TaxID=48095 RepID=A0ABR3UTK5_9PLEO